MQFDVRDKRNKINTKILKIRSVKRWFQLKSHAVRRLRKFSAFISSKSLKTLLVVYKYNRPDDEARTSETSVCFNVTTRHYIPEDFKLHTRRRENLKSHKSRVVQENVGHFYHADEFGRNWSHNEVIPTCTGQTDMTKWMFVVLNKIWVLTAVSCDASGFAVVWLRRLMPTFRRNMLPPSSELK